MMGDARFELAYERVESLLSSIRSRQFATDDDQPLDLVVTAHPGLANQLRAIARVREVTDADAITIQKQMDAVFMRESVALLEKSNACLAKSPDATLFKVENTARNSIDVIAANADCARFFAHRVGHVQSENNAKVFRYKQLHIDNLRSKSPAVWQAIRAGVPGVVTKIGNHAVVRGKSEIVYTPLSVIADSK